MMDSQASSALIRQGSESRTAGYVPVFGEKKPPSPAASAETFKALTEGAQAARQQAAQRTSTAKSAVSTGPEEKEGGFLSFIKTVIDVINPLQHIPVISAIYRHVTGDDLSPAARIAGDTLYGGPIGTMIALADVATQEATGNDVGGHVLAMLSPQDAKQPVPAQYAAIKESDIVWNTAAAPMKVAAADIPVEDVTLLINDADQNVIQKFSSASPTPRLKSGETHEPDAKSLPALSYKNAAATKRAAPAQSPLLAATPALLSMQETLEDANRMSASPGWTADISDNKTLIPARMMEGLDKYRMMQSVQTF